GSGLNRCLGLVELTAAICICHLPGHRSLPPDGSGMSERRATIDRMRPALKPGLLAVWRNRDTVQIGVDPRRAIALTGMGGAAVLLGLLDGSRDLAQIVATAGE